MLNLCQLRNLKVVATHKVHEKILHLSVRSDQKALRAMSMFSELCVFVGFVMKFWYFSP